MAKTAQINSGTSAMSFCLFKSPARLQDMVPGNLGAQSGADVWSGVRPFLREQH